MKKLLLFAAVLLLAASCNSNKTEQTDQAEDASAVAGAPVYKLDSLLVIADQMVDKTVTVRGFVTHTCKHSGKRCFIVGDDQKTSVRVEAKGEIGGFNRELIGSELAITGVLKERRMTKEYIDQYEEQVKEKKAQEDGSAETCEAELSNINGMRDWMKANNKDYYSTYYIDGESYDVIEG
ncbi:hypothetical protein [Dysgonomonas sp. 25]|uniref:OB-fold nucleic acid binding domain-containing protein n=1 Tax=Dysgonomonas sp. 25 TaxID=2302933 RepID=UPI0013D25F03|nr:hypothetical protein [Dysgonomonas sp. 25]NDV68501.1 hypothetical protein [Dysgonomonas sp. 25]